MDEAIAAGGTPALLAHVDTCAHSASNIRFVLFSNAGGEIHQMQRTFNVYAVVLCELRHSVIKNL
jgi:hypothetical protein